MAYALCRDVEIYVNYDFKEFPCIFLIIMYFIFITQSQVYSLVTINLQSALVLAHCFFLVAV